MSVDKLANLLICQTITKVTFPDNGILIEFDGGHNIKIDIYEGRLQIYMAIVDVEEFEI